MIKLYGFPVSNYYNMVKLALLEKGLDFEEVITRPNQQDDFLQKSPMGKVPCLVVDEGPLTETSVILDFVEELSSDINFYPADPYQKAKVKELMKSTELYLELVARRLLGALFFDQTLSEELRTEIIGQLEKGANALNKLLKFEPYAAGAEFTYADIVLYYTVTLGNQATTKLLDINLEDKLPGLHDWLALMRENSFVNAVDADQNAALKVMAG